MKLLLHVFAGKFESRDDACLYTEAQWSPEPSDSASDEEYAAWEDSNPKWKFRNELGIIYLDSDFIETIDGDDKYDYLESYLINKTDLNTIKASALDANIIVLLFPEAFGGFRTTLHSTSKMVYCGGFRFRYP